MRFFLQVYSVALLGGALAFLITGETVTAIALLALSAANGNRADLLGLKEESTKLLTDGRR
jgi:hypothetical protein